PGGTPPQIRRLLERCLRKDVRRRLPDIAEARIEIEDAGSERTTTTIRPAATASSRKREYVLAALLGVFVVATLALVARYVLAPNVEPAAVRFDIGPPSDSPFPNGAGPFLRLSPDGRKLAFIALAPTVGPRVFVRPIDAKAAQPLIGTEGIANVGSFFWS